MMLTDQAPQVSVLLHLRLRPGLPMGVTVPSPNGFLLDSPTCRQSSHLFLFNIFIFCSNKAFFVDRVPKKIIPKLCTCRPTLFTGTHRKMKGQGGR